MDPLDVLQADIMRTLAQPRRLQIIHRLIEGPVEVSRIAVDLGISQPNASQHLAVMRNAGVVEAERNGREVRYRITDPDIVAACAVMRRVLSRRLERLAGLSDPTRLAFDAGYPREDASVTPPPALPAAGPNPDIPAAIDTDRPLVAAATR